MLRIGLVGLTALVIAATAYGSPESQRFFLTQGPNGASCEIDAGVSGLPTSTWCVVGPPHLTFSKAVGVTLRASGRLEVCHGGRCVGNAPSGTSTLRYGRSITLGPFRCTSLQVGVRCIVTKLGHGFTLGAHGVTRV
jgi:hypothetical protein